MLKNFNINMKNLVATMLICKIYFKYNKSTIKYFSTYVNNYLKTLKKSLLNFLFLLLNTTFNFKNWFNVFILNTFLEC